MAQWTGLEPATPGVTGRYSNQLNYHCATPQEWWVMTGSNRRPSACKADALPAELITLVSRSGAHDRQLFSVWLALKKKYFKNSTQHPCHSRACHPVSATCPCA